MRGGRRLGKGIARSGAAWHNSAHATHAIVKLGGTVSPAAFPDVVLKTSEMFDME